MKCGFYEYDITPHLGSIIPGSFAARLSTVVQEPLFVRAFAAETDEKAVAIAVIDACGITQDITDRIRERVAAHTPLTAENVLVMATHCHGGGPTLNWGEEVVTEPAYLDLLVERAADSIIFAYRNAEESDVTCGSAELHGVSFIRVYRMKDGSYKTNPSRKTLELIDAPYTTIDPEVLVIGVEREGKPIGAIVNFANHPAIVAKTEISGDYISILSDEMKKAYGKDYITLFINGACGNINHVNPFDATTVLPGRHIVVGKAIAEKVQEILPKAEKMKNTTLASATTQITTHFRKPTAEALLAAKEVFDSFGDDLVNHVPGTKGYQQVFFALQAFRAMADKRTQRQMELQLLRIGDVYVAGTPTQIFVEFGKRIKAGFDGPCMVSAFSNDYCGYVPMPQFIGEPGVYEAKLCPTSALTGDAGDLVVDGMLGLKDKLS